MASAPVADILRAHPRPQYWTGVEVRRWLEAIELDVYAPTFEAAGVEGSDLVQLDAEGLKRRLGVASLGHRTKLLQNIAILSSRASQSFRREELSKDLAMKKKHAMESMYPDRLRKEEKQKQDEKLLQARADFWTPEDRGTQQAKPRTRPSSAAKQRSDDALSDYNNILEAPHAEPSVRRPVRSAAPGRRGQGVPPVPRPSTAKQRTTQRRAGAPATGEREREREREQHGEEDDLDGQLLPPSERKQLCSERIKRLEGTEEYEELVRALVEYGACLRIEGGDLHPGLVRTHFNLATTYLRQKLVPQALAHLKQAEEINEQSAPRQEAAAFRCRILEGMGICETRMGHYHAAQALLDKAKKLCAKGEEGREGEGEEEEAGDGATPPSSVPAKRGLHLTKSGSSVLVAMSELHSAQGLYDDAVDALIEAWQLKEAELSPTHPQVGKLFSAMGTIKQKQLRYKSDLLSDVKATLESAQRIKDEIHVKTQGIQLKVGEEERTVAQLECDIGNMSKQRKELEKEVLACKADVLEYMNRAKKVALHNTNGTPELGSEAAKLVSLVQSLATRFAREEADRLSAMVEQEQQAKEAEGGDGMARRGSGDDKLEQWLAEKGASLAELGLDQTEQRMEQTEELITRFRQQADTM